MRCFRFTNGYIVIRWPWISSYGIQANTVIGFWRTKKVWQFTFLILGFGFQVTNETGDTWRKEEK